MKQIPYIGLLLALAVSACSPQPQVSEEVQVAVIVSLTQTAAAPQNQPAPPAETLPTPQPAEAFASPQPLSDYYPLSSEECTTLEAYISQSVGFTGEITNPVPFNDYVAEKNGDGCQIQYSATRPTELSAQVQPSLTSLGWQEDDRYGAGGIGGSVSAFRNSDMLCMYASQVQAVDENACPTGEGYMLCMMSLPPEALFDTVT
ncbi:MAG: hypothetical protein FJ031_14305 [Chloroflexi bacterium]|nr:hypothetical protein [Chloroflexota bacterium]